MPVFSGRFASRSLSASRPPAEAPTPTTTNGASLDRRTSVTSRLSAGDPACNDSEVPILTSMSLPLVRWNGATARRLVGPCGISYIRGLYHAVHHDCNRHVWLLKNFSKIFPLRRPAVPDRSYAVGRFSTAAGVKMQGP